jgi:5-methylcytosine-specific restriction endonuclease McrA
VVVRDGHRCQGCGVLESEYDSDLSLDVHHIRPIQTFQEPEDGNRLENLITLCRACHRRAERMAPLLPSGIEQPAAD